MTKENKDPTLLTSSELMEMGSKKGREIGNRVLSNFPNFPEGVGNPANPHGLTDEDLFKGHCDDEWHFTDTLQELRRIYDSCPHFWKITEEEWLKPYRAEFGKAINEVWEDKMMKIADENHIGKIM